MSPNPFISSSIYQLSCKECPKKQTGQMARTFKIRYNEHIQDIRKKKLQNMHNTYWKRVIHMAPMKHTKSPLFCKEGTLHEQPEKIPYL
jgi:hypothetical protein